MVSFRMISVSIILLFSVLWALVIPLTGQPHLCDHSYRTEKVQDCCSHMNDKPSACNEGDKDDAGHQHHCSYLCTCGCHVMTFEMIFFNFIPSENHIQMDQQIASNYHFDYFVSVWQPPRLG
ncbi:MAG: hypothetical protein ACOYXB_11200 [Bacteroidota bacterium]